MKLLKTIAKIERIDQLIRLKATGTPSQLAKRLSISERSVFNILNMMKELGAPIHYSGFRQSYYYEESVNFRFGFFKDSDLL